MVGLCVASGRRKMPLGRCQRTNVAVYCRFEAGAKSKAANFLASGNKW